MPPLGIGYFIPVRSGARLSMFIDVSVFLKQGLVLKDFGTSAESRSSTAVFHNRAINAGLQTEDTRFATWGFVWRPTLVQVGLKTSSVGHRVAYPCCSVKAASLCLVQHPTRLQASMRHT